MLQIKSDTALRKTLLKPYNPYSACLSAAATSSQLPHRRDTQRLTQGTFISSPEDWQNCSNDVVSFPDIVR